MSAASLDPPRADLTRATVDTYQITRADREVLCRYSGGLLTRTQTMEALGIDWYGELLVPLTRARVPMPLV